MIELQPPEMMKNLLGRNTQHLTVESKRKQEDMLAALQKRVVRFDSSRQTKEETRFIFSPKWTSYDEQEKTTVRREQQWNLRQRARRARSGRTRMGIENMNGGEERGISCLKEKELLPRNPSLLLRSSSSSS